MRAIGLLCACVRARLTRCYAVRRLQDYKSKYLLLHDAVLKTYANEKQLLTTGRQLKQVRCGCAVQTQLEL